MKLSPFSYNKDRDKFRVKPSIKTERAKDDVAKRLLRSYIGYWGTFVLWLVVSYNFIPMVFILGSIMWILGGIAAMKLPAESHEIARKTRFTMLGYLLSLLAFRLIITMVLDTPVEMWEKALRMQLPDAFANTFMGFLSMAFMIAMFMGFVGYISYVVQLFMFHRSDKRTSDYMRTLMRKGDDS